jgi:hypothetical protein
LQAGSPCRSRELLVTIAADNTSWWASETSPDQDLCHRYRSPETTGRPAWKVIVTVPCSSVLHT